MRPRRGADNDTGAPRTTQVPHPRLLEWGLITCLTGAYLALSPLDIRPYGDPKLFVVSIGACLVWLSGARTDRRLSIVAGAWVGVCVLSAIFGVDAKYSLIGNESFAAGLVLFSVCAYLLAVCASLPQDIVRKIPRWLVTLGLVTTAILLFIRLFGSALGSVGSFAGLSWGSTLGHPVPLIGLLGVSLAALLSRRDKMGSTRFHMALVTLSGGIGLAKQISSFLILLVVLSIWTLKSRPGIRQTATTAGTALVIVSLLLVLVGPAPSDGPPPLARPGPATSAQTGPASDLERLLVWDVGLRAFEKRPILGWGPANSGMGFLSSETSSEAAKLVETRWGDMHNIFVELAVSTGFLGLLAFLYLLTEIVPWAVRAPRDLGWAAGGAAAIGLMLMYEPILIETLTLISVLAGASVSWRRASARGPGVPHFPKTARAGAGVVLAACLALSSTAAVSNALVFWGVRHDSVTALHLAAVLQPFRVQNQEDYAYSLVLDPQNGSDPSQISRAKKLANALVEQHPWDIEVRLESSWALAQAGDPGGASRLIEEHLARFPADRDYVMKILDAGVPHL